MMISMCRRPRKPQRKPKPSAMELSGVEGHGGVVQLELLERVAQVAVLRAVGGIDAGEDHRLRLLVAGQRGPGGILHARDGVAHARVGDGFDGGGEIADLARAERLGGTHAERVQIPDLDDLVLRAGRHHADVHAGAHDAVHDAQIDDRAAVGVVLAVEDEALERGLAVALGRGDALHDHLEHRVDVDAVFGGDLGRVHGRQADDVLDLVLDLLGSGRGEIDLVDDGQHLEIVVDGEVGVGERLGLDALGGVDDEHRALAGGEAARDLVVEVDVARRVDEIQDVVLPVVGPVLQAHGAGLDGDAALALEIHLVEDLRLHLALVDGVALLEQPVGERGLAVVDVGHDAEITQFGQVGHRVTPS
jgi:hypothetical protein